MTKGRTLFQQCGPFLLALLLSACSDRTTPSAQENEQLNNAAEMLDAAPEILSDIDGNAAERPERNAVEPPQ